MDDFTITTMAGHEEVFIFYTQSYEGLIDSDKKAVLEALEDLVGSLKEKSDD